MGHSAQTFVSTHDKKKIVRSGVCDNWVVTCYYGPLLKEVESAGVSPVGYSLVGKTPCVSAGPAPVIDGQSTCITAGEQSIIYREANTQEDLMTAVHCCFPDVTWVE